MTVDTLTIARELKAADLPSGQAAAIGRPVTETTATKAGLELAKQQLRADIQTVRVELERTRNQLLTWLKSAMVALADIIIAVVKL